MNNVCEYIRLEYDIKYYLVLSQDKKLVKYFDFVGSYYMGGSTVPESARYLVDLIDMNNTNVTL